MDQWTSLRWMLLWKGWKVASSHLWSSSKASKTRTEALKGMSSNRLKVFACLIDWKVCLISWFWNKHHTGTQAVEAWILILSFMLRYPGQVLAAVCLRIHPFVIWYHSTLVALVILALSRKGIFKMRFLLIIPHFWYLESTSSSSPLTFPFPWQVHILRGNHENEQLNERARSFGGGFAEECLAKYGPRRWDSGWPDGWWERTRGLDDVGWIEKLSIIESDWVV